MTRPIDANLLAEMFARAADLKVARSGEARRSGRELLESIFTRARELQLGQPPATSDRGPAGSPDTPTARHEEDTAPLVEGRTRAAPAPPKSDEVARGWNEQADGGAPERARAGLAGETASRSGDDSSSREAGERSRRTHHTDGRRAAPSSDDPDDLVRTRFLERESAIDEFRSSLEALFAHGDSDEALLPVDSTEEAVDAGASAEPPLADVGPLPRSALFTQAAESLFGVALEELEQLVLEAWERRVRGEPSPVLAPPPPVGPTASPALASLEDGEPLLTRRAEQAVASSDVDHLLSGFAFEGGNPVPAAEVARRAKDQVRAAAAPASAPPPPPAPPPAAPAARRVEQPPTLAWGAAPPRDAVHPGAPRAAQPDPFARPREAADRFAPSSSTLRDDRAPIALPGGGVSFPRPQDLLASSTVHDEGGPIALPVADGTIHDGGAPIPLPAAGVPLPDATIHDDRAPIALPGQQLGRGAAAFAPHDAFAPHGGDAFAPQRPAPTGWPALTPPGWQPAAPQAAPQQPPGGHAPPPGWQTGTGRHAALPPQQPAAWKAGSGPQPALPQPGWRPPSGAQPALPPGAGWRPGSGAHPLGPAPPAPPAAPPVVAPDPAAQHVPAGWPFVDAPAPAPASGRHARPQPPSGRHARPQPPSGRHAKPSPLPPPGKPKGPPSGEGFDPFAPSWWDERPSDEDLNL